MYSSAADALISLLNKAELHRITQMPSEIIRLKNGVKYFQVEVTSVHGEQYAISAYNEEAEELYRMAKSSASQLLVTA